MKFVRLIGEDKVMFKKGNKRRGIIVAIESPPQNFISACEYCDLYSRECSCIIDGKCACEFIRKFIHHVGYIKFRLCRSWRVST